MKRLLLIAVLLLAQPAGAEERDVHDYLLDMFRAQIAELSDFDDELCPGGTWVLTSTDGVWTCEPPGGGLFLPLLGGTVTGTLVSEGEFSVGAVDVFANGDATPIISDGSNFRTGTTPVTITSFDAGVSGLTEGHRFLITTGLGAVTYDCNASLLCGGGSTDIVTTQYDITEWIVEGFNFRLTNHIDNDGSPTEPVFAAVMMTERASVPATSSGVGAWWVQDLAPTVPMFTDDLDNDFQLAYLISPALAGDPTAPTPGLEDNDGSVATTEFVQRRLRECQQNITTEEATDILMCGKAIANILVVELNCVALGAVTPVAQIVEVVECDGNGATCVGSGFTVTAVAVETNYTDAAGTDDVIDTGDWWGIELSSFTTAAEFLNCQVEYFQF